MRPDDDPENPLVTNRFRVYLQDEEKRLNAERERITTLLWGTRALIAQTPASMRMIEEHVLYTQTIGRVEAPK